MLLGFYSLASLRREIHDRGHAVAIVTPGTLLAMAIDAGIPTDGFLPEDWLSENRAAIEEEMRDAVRTVLMSAMLDDQRIAAPGNPEEGRAPVTLWRRRRYS
jgi:hypothetical protein